MTRLTLILLSLISFSFSGSFQHEKFDFVELNGKKLYYVDKGSGSPTIIFVTGLGVSMDNFYKLQTKMCKTSRTILYDRAGIGRSESLDNERNLENISSELNTVLSKIGNDKPVILVGHSRGGLVVRYFANKYPDKVLGLILIDPTNLELRFKRRALRTDAEKIQFDNFYKAFYSDSAKFTPTIKNEFKNFYASDSVLLAGMGFPKTIPVTIIASVKTTSEKYSKEDTKIKIQLLNEQVKSASQIKLIFTDKAGHFIHDDEPMLVTNEILSMVKQIRSQNGK